MTEESTIKPVAVHLADHVNLNDFIFDGNETERPPFQFNCGCCSDKIDDNRSFLLLYFHYFIIGAIVFFSIAYLAFAENSSLQTDYRHFVNVHRLLGTKRKTMNKRIRTDPHCFISIAGPCGSGKTQLVSNMLKNQSKIFQPCFDEIVYLYNHYQKHYDTLLVNCVSQKHSIEFHQGLNWSEVERCEARKLRTLVVIDDLYQQACEDEYFINLVIAGRHRNIYFIALKHNLFQQSKHSKTIKLNVTQMISFKSPSDLEQIGVLGRQMGDRQLLIDAYKKATQAPFGHLMIDFDSHTDAELNLCSNCSGTGP